MNEEVFTNYSGMNTTDALDMSFDLYRASFLKHFITTVVFCIFIIGALFLTVYFSFDKLLPLVSGIGYNALISGFAGVAGIAAAICFLALFLNLLLKAANVTIAKNTLLGGEMTFWQIFADALILIPKVFTLAIAYMLVFVPAIFLLFLIYFAINGATNIMDSVTQLILEGNAGDNFNVYIMGIIAIIIVIYILYVFFSFSVSASIFEKKNFFGAVAKSFKFSSAFFFKNGMVFALWSIFRFTAIIIVAFLLSYVIKTPEASSNQHIYNVIFMAIRFAAASVLTSIFTPVTATLHTTFYLKCRAKIDNFDVEQGCNMLLKKISGKGS